VLSTIHIDEGAISAFRCANNSTNKALNIVSDAISRYSLLCFDASPLLNWQRRHDERVRNGHRHWPLIVVRYGHLRAASRDDSQRAERGRTYSAGGRRAVASCAFGWAP